MHACIHVFSCVAPGAGTLSLEIRSAIVSASWVIQSDHIIEHPVLEEGQA